MLTMTEPVLRATDGTVLPLDVASWRRDADDVELDLLRTLPAPVLDVGCGPGRIVRAVASTGRMAMGVEISSAASAEAARRGAAVLTRSVFDPLPGERRWGSVVLFDGNIGIGGDPGRLLRRAHTLLAGHGRLLVEVGEPGSKSEQLTVRVEHGRTSGPWFPWACISADDIGAHLTDAGFGDATVRCHSGRWFATAGPS